MRNNAESAIANFRPIDELKKPDLLISLHYISISLTANLKVSLSFYAISTYLECF